jgi:hypothetical protein
VRKPEYLNVSGAGDGAEIREQVILDSGGSQSGQEDNVGKTLIDRRECSVERLDDHDVVGDVPVKSPAQSVGLNPIGLYGQEPRHGPGTFMLRSVQIGRSRCSTKPLSHNLFVTPRGLPVPVSAGHSVTHDETPCFRFECQ